MEIELPDGTILEAPDGSDPAKVYRAYAQQKWAQKNPAEYDVNSQAYKDKYGPTEMEDRLVIMRGGAPVNVHHSTDMAAAVGSGMERGWKGLTNLALPDSLTPEWASDENIREMDKRDEPLSMPGKLMGNILSTAPLGGGTGKALELGGRALPLASKVLSSPITRTMAEGGLQGAIYADPEEQGKGALTGSLLAYGLNRIGAAGGRLARGLVGKSDAAQEIQQLAGQHGDEIFIPVSQAASEDTLLNRFIKGFYKEGLPVIPGVRGKITRQAEQASDKLRAIAVKEGTPTGTPLPPDIGRRPEKAIGYLRDEFNKAYDETIKSYTFNVPQNIEAEVKAAFQTKAGPKTTVNPESLDKVAGDVKRLFDKFSGGTSEIDGTNIRNLKEELTNLLREAPGYEKIGYQAADEMVDDLVRNELRQGGNPQNLADLQRYEELTPAYRAFYPLSKAAEGAAADEGRFLFRTLAEQAKRSPEQRGIGQLGREVLDRSAVGNSKTSQALTRVGWGLGAAGAKFAPLSTATVVGAGNALASKPVQRLLLGDTKMQRIVAEALRKNPQLKRRLGSLARAGVVTSAERGE